MVRYYRQYHFLSQSNVQVDVSVSINLFKPRGNFDSWVTRSSTKSGWKSRIMFDNLNEQEIYIYVDY